MKYKLLLTSLLLLSGILCSFSLSGQKMSDSKTYMKSFRAGDDAVLEVTNKYGDIHISHTSRDSIKVTAEVTASSDDEDKVRSMMSDVDVSLTMTSGTVRAETTFDKGFTSLFESIKGLTKDIINFDSKLTVNYNIECPSYTKLRLTNSYGNIYIGDATPELTLKLSNGSLDAGEVKKAQSLELIFSKANVRNIDEGEVVLSFSELRMKEAGNIRFSSVSSKVWIDNCDTADIDSKRDDLNIGNVSVMTGTTYFSDINTATITDELSLVMKYGNLSCESVDARFSLIDIRASYTDVDLVMPEKAGYEYEIRHTNAFVSLPGIEPKPEVTEIDAEEKKFMTSGRYGSSPDRSNIRIEAYRGEIRIVQK